jgi:hypothetical protein
MINSIGPSHNLHCHMEYGQFTSPFSTVDPSHLHVFLGFEFLSDEAILEAMTSVSILWEDLHPSLCFLPFWETF